MNWTQEARTMLREYTAKTRAIESISGELRRLEMEARRIRSATADGTPVKGGGSSREDRLLSNIVKRQSLEARLKEARLWRKNVDGALDCLSDQERTILDRLYIRPAQGNVDRLCQELALERSSVYYQRDKALRHFTVAMFGCAES